MAGLATGLLIDEPIAAVIGFGWRGAGLSCIAPQVFSIAGLRNPRRAGPVIARVASIGFLGFAIGLALIGAVCRTRRPAMGARRPGRPRAVRSHGGCPLRPL